MDGFVRRTFLGSLILAAAVASTSLVPPAAAQGQPKPPQDLTNWLPPYDVQDRASRDRPALARKGNTLCLAWRGVLENEIWVSITRETWTSQRRLADRGTRNSPALCAVGDKFVMVWHPPTTSRPAMAMEFQILNFKTYDNI